MTILRRVTHGTPLGELTLVADASGLRAVLWPDDDPRRTPLTEFALHGAHDDRGSTDPDDVLARTAEQLDEYFSGDRTGFDLPLAPTGTPFQLHVWSILRTIPYGATMSYAEQAAVLGDRNKARAVGAANGRNPLSVVVPCHRVTATGGRLGGFAGGLDAKAWLLHHERRIASTRQE